MKYHADQFRAARAGLRLETRDIADKMKWSLRTVAEIEHADKRKLRPPSDAAIAQLVEFYEQHGVTFLPGAAGRGFGVRFRSK